MHIKHIFVYLLLLTAVIVYAQDKTELIVKDSSSTYANILQNEHPHLNVVSYNTPTPMQHFYEGKNIEAYYSQALPIINVRKDYAFTPHYIQTVVIAIDRNQTQENITSFESLLKSTLPINFAFGPESSHRLWDSPETAHIVTSMAYALYGSYDIESIAKDFYKINNEGRFFYNDTRAPISVMYDTEAVELIKNGRNIQIVIPSDGTHSFISGILHKKDSVQIKNTIDNVIVSNGLRSASGHSDSAFYPHISEYTDVTFINDFKAYNTAANLVGPELRREAFEFERYGFYDTDSRVVFYLFFLIFLMLYMISINRRITNLSIRYAIVIACSFQIMLVTMGCLKALIYDNALVETILWYGYYFAFIFIPALYLYVALASGYNSEVYKLSILYKLYLVFSSLLAIFVFTNNLHGLVFIVYDYTNSTFDYNNGYYIVMGWIYGTICVALAILMYKVFRMPRKLSLLFPLIMNIFIMCFIVGYARRIPLFYDLDFAYSINVLITLYMEACLQSKLFPVNTQYRKMFAHSQLCMEIRDNNDVCIEHSNFSFINEKDYVLRTTPIAGGNFLYFEDYTELNKTNSSLKSANKQLKINIKTLKEQGKVEAELASLAAEKAVYDTINNILNTDTAKLNIILKKMKRTKNLHRLMNIINILVCGIKRKCILRINTLYKKNQKVEDFINIIGEMQEFTKHLPLRITIGCTYDQQLTIKQAMSMYEMFCLAVEKSALAECADVLVQLYESKNSIVFSVTPDKNINTETIAYYPDGELENFGANFKIKPLDDTTAFILTFAKEGEIHA